VQVSGVVVMGHGPEVIWNRCTLARYSDEAGIQLFRLSFQRMPESSDVALRLSFPRKRESSSLPLIVVSQKAEAFTRLRRASHFLCPCKESNQRKHGVRIQRCVRRSHIPVPTSNGALPVRRRGCRWAGLLPERRAGPVCDEPWTTSDCGRGTALRSRVSAGFRCAADP
jgi:hypothetical protein